MNHYDYINQIMLCGWSATETTHSTHAGAIVLILRRRGWEDRVWVAHTPEERIANLQAALEEARRYPDVHHYQDQRWPV